VQPHGEKNMIIKLLLKFMRLFSRVNKSFETVYHLHVRNTVPSSPDTRDYVAVFPDVTLPTEYTIPEANRVRNQGAIGSCASHGVCSVMEIQYKMQQDLEFDGSELYHYYMARKHVNNTFPDDKGMTVRDAYKTAQKYGVSHEKLWKYDTTKFNVEPSPLAHSFSRFFVVKEYQKLETIEDIKKSLIENIPVGCGIICDDAFLSLKRGQFWIPKKKGNKGGHFVTIIGYNDNTQRFIIRNSWGVSWGTLGNFEIPYDNFKLVSFDWYRAII
jgi:C1A family cysteine protease